MNIGQLFARLQERDTEFEDRLRGKASSAPASSPVASSADYAAAEYDSSVNLHTEQFRHFRDRAYAPINLIAKIISGQEVIVAKRVTKPAKGRGLKSAHRDWLPNFVKSHADQYETIPDHPIYDLIRNPNDIMIDGTLLYLTAANLKITGKYIWWVNRLAQPDEEGRTATIWPFPAHWATPIHSPTLFAKWKIQKPGQVKFWIAEGADVLYFYYPDPADPLSAKGPLQAMARTLLSDESQGEAQRKSFDNSANPGLLIKVGRHPELRGLAGVRGGLDSPGSSDRPFLTDKQRREINGWVKSMYRGTMRWGEPLIIDGLIESVDHLWKTPREMDFLNSSKITEAQINKGFGVNGISMGQVEGANRASSTVADEHLNNNTINPDLRLISSTMTAWLGPMFAQPSEDLLVYLPPRIAVDSESRDRELQKMLDSGVGKFNEWREKLGLPPIEEYDEYLVTNQGLKKIGEEEEPEPEEPTAAMPPDDEDEEEEDDDDDDDAVDAKKSKRIASTVQAMDLVRLARSVDIRRDETGLAIGFKERFQIDEVR